MQQTLASQLSSTLINSHATLVLVGTYRLRSSGQKLLVVPRTTRKTFGDRAFSKAGPVVWNSLPLNIRETSNVSTFKKLLKTFLFTKAFDL